LRKLAIGFLVAVLQSSATIQNLAIFGVMAFFILLTILLKPYLNKRDYWVEIINNSVQTIADFSIFLYVQLDIPYRLSGRILTFYSIIIQFSGLAIYFVLIIYDTFVGIRHIFRKCLGLDKVSETTQGKQDSNIADLKETKINSILNKSMDLKEEKPMDSGIMADFLVENKIEQEIIQEIKSESIVELTPQGLEKNSTEFDKA